MKVIVAALVENMYHHLIMVCNKVRFWPGPTRVSWDGQIIQ